ncbi:baseplate assembly protein [Chelativorans sp. ZYF759]|uniref:phage baseplate assembly protein V n=1 Tax=Chelativorans sp. ZYF759 TaxID=2692213 RepID=UPI00145DA314|nr:phage baseplate assembly protein V [Chelativorans sp. ZYF759]NMG39810.1 baseplate assembly protein [Chelativorans sp. ZYF759]
MASVVAEIKADVEMLKTAFGNSLKVGPVEEVDAQKGYRLKLGEGPDGPYLSPWYPHPESGGATKSWAPLSKGQIVGVINPTGDPRQGILLRAGFSGQDGAPSSDLAENVLQFGGVTLSIKDGVLTIHGDVQINGSMLRHNDRNVGDDHVHTDVKPGGGTSGPPQ